MNLDVSESKTEHNADIGQTCEQEIFHKLKGDTIGDTMYTQRFVLETLLKLRDLEWNEELENDLCFLWDSTVEKQVCDYLMEVNFPSIACGVILEYNTIGYGRLNEILVGIIANISTAKCEKPLENEHIDVIQNLLISTDSLVLIQVMRFITALLHNDQDLALLANDKAEDTVKLIKFILSSSTNFELIQKTLEALSKITAKFKGNLFFEEETLEIVVNACVRVMTADEENDFELFTSDQRTNAKYVVEYVVNFCVYINETEPSYFKNIENSSNVYVDFFTKLCEWYSVQENLVPITDEVLYYFEATNYIFLTIKVDYNDNLFKNIFLILKILIDNKCEDIDEIIEMCCYFIQKGNSKKIKTNLISKNVTNIEKTCKFLEKRSMGLKFNFEFNKDKLRELY